MASFRIHEDQENRGQEFRKIHKEPLQQQKRSVLGILNKNGTGIPIQKSKQTAASKQENVQGKQKNTVQNVQNAQGIPFKIHEDNLVEEKTVAQKNDCSEAINKRIPDLPATITALHRLPLQDISDKQNDTLYEDENAGDSPMSLDRSLVTTPTKQTSKPLQLNLSDVDEYREEIYQYLREAETRHRPKSGYMRKQPDINYSMRSILVDWLVEVAEEYRLQTETLYLAVSYIDRFLSYMSVVRAKLQLVGTAAMFIAAKYEEIYPPDVGEFVYITDDTYTKRQVLRMEHLILKVLAFDLSVPTILSFITTYAVSCQLSDTTMYLAMYLSELSLLEGDPYFQYLPSEIAAAAIAVARYTLELDVWPKEIEETTGYTLERLRPCISSLNITFANAGANPQQAIREKYKSNRWQSVSLQVPRSPSL